ncbi:carbonic anhydrase, partial [Coprinopsis marcescibilis]
RRQTTTPVPTEFEDLFLGNQRFRTDNGPLIEELAEDGQHPRYLFLGCSDSRVAEGTVFDALPGTLFTERNIANLFESGDANAQAVVAYGVEHLHTRHVIVMGHYGCGGVAASIASQPAAPWDDATAAIEAWIAPIRSLYSTSTRPEIVALRAANALLPVAPTPGLEEPGFRALVEENVKRTVSNIASNAVV